MKHLYYIVIVSVVVCICFVTFGCGSREEEPELSGEDAVSEEIEETDRRSHSRSSLNGYMLL
jgi:hypothetical protein